ncbi:MAG TPA: glycosyl hydrolase family 28-related protein, partial [Puia sp.]|nr:glycosyl hydrolase family 28-related protein [Puia sp.]
MNRFTSTTIAAAGLFLYSVIPVAGLQAQDQDLLSPIPHSERDISWYVHNAPFPMTDIQLPSFPDRFFLLNDYGAVGDGHTLNTSAFAKAIRACSAAGGGRVVVPAGQFLTGPIELLSHVDLHLEKGAAMLFTKDHTQ